MSKICAFFGHRDVHISNLIEEELEKLIDVLVNEQYDEFWCGDHGTFDKISLIIAKRLRDNKYPHIKVCHVCSYSPEKYYNTDDDCDIIYPEVVAKGHPRFAILRRNKYVVEHAAVIVFYVTRPSGGAYKAMQTAQKLNKRIINLADLIS